jgi:hypothetical protein
MVVDPCDVKPGTYRGALEFRERGGAVAHRLPLRVKVWDVRYPGAEALHYEMEHCWFTMPGGYWIEKDHSHKAAVSSGGKKLFETPLHDPEVLGNYVRSLAGLEVDFAQSWSDVARLYPLPFLRLRESGALLSEELRKNPERVRKELPHLDFSFLDDYFDQAVAAGMRYYAMNYSRETDGTLGLARQVAGDDKLPAESEIHRRVRAWYWGEYARYLRERGLLGVHTKVFDEFSAKQVPAFVASARAIRAAGFRTYTTTYNFNRDPAAVKAIAPYLDLWQVGWEFDVRRRLGLGDDRAVWGTTASSFWGNNSDYARGAGWVASRLRYDGLHTHGYMRWFWNDHEGCFVGPREPFNSVAVTHYAQGVAEGRYLAQLYRLIDRAKRSERTARLAAEVERELESTVVGKEAGCLVRLMNQPAIPGGGFVEYWWPKVCLSPGVYEAAKVKVFELTLRLRRGTGALPSALRYGDFTLARGAKAEAVLVGEGPAVERLAASVKALIRVALQRRETWGKGPALVVGTVRGPAALRGLIEKELKGEVTAHYPRAGHYLIRLMPAAPGRPRVLLVVGGDAAGVEKGVTNLVKLLDRTEKALATEAQRHRENKKRN